MRFRKVGGGGWRFRLGGGGRAFGRLTVDRPAERLVDLLVSGIARVDGVELEAVRRAGDALAAGFLLGGSLEEAARRGLEAAARCVARVGALP